MLTAASMTGDDVGRLIKRRMRDIGLPASLSSHSFRAGIITYLRSIGVLLEDLQILAGHAYLSTTQLYDHTPKEVTRRIVNAISV